MDIKNPGFELDTDVDNIPDGWILMPQMLLNHEIPTISDLKSWRIDKNVSHTGSSSIKLGNISELDEGIWSQDDIMIPSGAKYLKLTAWIKSENVRTSTCGILLSFKDENDAILLKNEPIVTVASNTDWTPYYGSIKVPESAVKVGIIIVNWHVFITSGNYWIDDITIEAVKKPLDIRAHYLDEKDWPEVSSRDKKKKFIVFSRYYTSVLMRNAVPFENEIIDALKIKACPGEYEPATFALFALDDIHNLKVSISPLKFKSEIISSDNVNVRSVYYTTRVGQNRWGVFQEAMMDDVPMFLEERKSVDISKGNNQAFWVTVKVPETALPGCYTGDIEIENNNEKTIIPLELEVYPFKLSQKKGITFAMYSFITDKDEKIEEVLSDLKNHGMTSFTIIGNTGLSIDEIDGRLIINWNGKSAFEKYMKRYKVKGFTAPVLWLMNAEIPKKCNKFGKIDTEQFALVYIDIIKQIQSHIKAQDWPEIIYQPVDEPFEHEHNLSRMMQLSALLKSIPGVRTENDGMNGKWENFTDKAYRLTDVLNFHDGPMLDRHNKVDMGKWWKFNSKAHGDGKLLWYYNIDLSAWHTESVRYMSGYGLWASGADGIIEWSYMSDTIGKDPNIAYKPTSMMYRFPAKKDTSGGPTLGFEAIREGIDDYRYIVSLEKALERVYSSGSLEIIEQAYLVSRPVYAKISQAIFNGCSGVAAQGKWNGKCEIREDGGRIIRGELKLDNNFKFEDYDAIREMAANAIIEINKLLYKKN